MDDPEKPTKGSNLELIHWKSLEEWEAREVVKIREPYKTFDAAAEAIDQYGPLEVHTDRANAFFIRTSGRFEDDIVAMRQSGLNVRRILISRQHFDSMYGSFPDCINRVLSNNAIGPEVEIAHLRDYADAMDLVADGMDPERKCTRGEIDAIAILQMLQIRDEILAEISQPGSDLGFIFDIGFTAGRAFSALQNLVTLEPEASHAMDTKRKAGVGGAHASQQRRRDNLDILAEEIEKLSGAVGLISEERIVEQAIETAREREPKFPKSRKTLDDYGTALRSEEPFKSRYDAVFRKNP